MSAHPDDLHSDHDPTQVGVTAQELRDAMDRAMRRATAPLMARMDLLEQDLAMLKRQSIQQLCRPPPPPDPDGIPSAEGLVPR